MSYRLWYFPIRGRAEQIRLLLNVLGQPYEDVPMGRDRLMELKKEGPKALMFGSLPVLEDGELRLAQGPVIMGYLARKHGIAPTDLQLAAKADAITLGAEDLRSKFFGLLSGEGAEEKQASFLAGDWHNRWLPSLEKLLELNGNTGFFVGSSVTHADIAVWDALDGMLTRVKGASLEGFPALLKFREHIAALPQLAPHIQRRS